MRRRLIAALAVAAVMTSGAAHAAAKKPTPTWREDARQTINKATTQGFIYKIESPDPALVYLYVQTKFYLATIDIKQSLAELVRDYYAVGGKDPVVHIMDSRSGKEVG